MNQSEHINELAKALAQAQGEFPVLEKKSKAHNYNYADLAETLQATQDVLKSHGLSIVHQVHRDNIMITKLIHSSGQWISTEMLLIHKPDGRTTAMQALGSAITYAKRYSIGCLLNLAADKEIDDDGASSSPKQVNEVSSPPTLVKEKVRLPRLSHEQVKIVEDYLKEFPESREVMLERYNVESVEELPYDKFEQIVKIFEKKRENNG